MNPTFWTPPASINLSIKLEEFLGNNIWRISRGQLSFSVELHVGQRVKLLSVQGTEDIGTIISLSSDKTQGTIKALSSGQWVGAQLIRDWKPLIVPLIVVSEVCFIEAEKECRLFAAVESRWNREADYRWTLLFHPNEDEAYAPVLHGYGSAPIEFRREQSAWKPGTYKLAAQRLGSKELPEAQDSVLWALSESAELLSCGQPHDLNMPLDL